MPVSVYPTKKFDYGQGATPSIEQVWIADGDEDESVILPAILANLPQTFGIYFLQNFSANHMGGGLWEVPVRYGPFRYEPLPPRQIGQNTISFSTSGGTQHITQSKGTTSYSPPSTVAPDFKGGINVTSDNVEGVDIVSPVFNFTYTVIIPASVITLSYALGLGEITGTVNNGTWKGFPGGSLRFDGVDGSLRSSADSEIGFKFAYSRNATGLSVGTITGISKLGWEYLWVRYKRNVDNFTHVRIPRAVYVEKVYDYTNFGALGIGS